MVGNPTAKKCKRDWFQTYNLIEKYNLICEETKFLDAFNPTIKQRLWHIINDKTFVKCGNPNCNNPPTFFSFHLFWRKETPTALASGRNSDHS